MVIVSQFAGKLKYRGVYDFTALYKQVFGWLEENNYVPFEDVFKHKPPGEFQVDIRGEKKITSYVMYRVLVKFYSENFKEIDVEKDGKKKKMFSGNMNVIFLAIVETDYEKDEDGSRLWESTPFYERLKHFFENYIFKWRFLFKHPDTVMNEVMGLLDDIKATMDLEGKMTRYERLHEVKE